MSERSSSPPTVLVVDDDEAMREVLRVRLEGWGYRVLLAASGSEAEERAIQDRPDLAISDVVLPDQTGIELLPKLRAAVADRPVILITAHGTVELAVEAMKEGAYDFLTKPLDYEKLERILRSAFEERALRHQSRRLAHSLASGSGVGDLIGESDAIVEVYELLREVAPSEATVLIHGESGTGKELAARAIHQLSPRSEAPFVALNAAAIPAELMESELFGHEKGAFTGAQTMHPGCFELAHRGTLFLDEISEMPLQLQPKLLRVLEDRRVRRLGGRREFELDVRIVAATNRDPLSATEEGRLREDLYYRLNVFSIRLPPLRERKGDLPLLARHFVHELSQRNDTPPPALDEEACSQLLRYDWPGNVRELRNAMERAAILSKGERIGARHLPPYIRDLDEAAGSEIVLPVGTTVAEAEKELILRTHEQTGYNKAQTARLLGLDVKTVRSKLRAYGTHREGDEST